MIFVSGPKKQTDVLLAIFVLLVVLCLSPLLIMLLPAILFYLIRRKREKRAVLAHAEEQWLAQGKRVLFFTSDRKIWKTYFEEQILSRIKSQSIIWNWSTRIQDGWNEDLLEAKIHRLCIRRRDFCPCAVVFTKGKPPQFFFFEATYVDWVKSKKPAYLEQERAFLELLG